MRRACSLKKPGRPQNANLFATLFAPFLPHFPSITVPKIYDLPNQTPLQPAHLPLLQEFAAHAYTANNALKANQHYTHAVPRFKCRKCAKSMPRANLGTQSVRYIQFGGFCAVIRLPSSKPMRVCQLRLLADKSTRPITLVVLWLRFRGNELALQSTPAKTRSTRKQ